MIESGQDKWAAFYFPVFDPDRGSKAFQNLLFLNSRNKSVSWFSVYSFVPGFHYGSPGLCDSGTTCMSAMHSLLAAMLAGSSNATAKSECKYVPLNGSVWEWQWLITSWSAPTDKKRYLLQKPLEEFMTKTWLESCSQSDQIQPGWIKNLPDCAAPLQ